MGVLKPVGRDQARAMMMSPLIEQKPDWKVSMVCRQMPAEIDAQIIRVA